MCKVLVRIAFIVVAAILCGRVSHVRASASSPVAIDVARAEAKAEISRAFAEAERYQDVDVKRKAKELHLYKLDHARATTEVSIKESQTRLARIIGETDSRKSDLEIRRQLFTHQLYYNIAIFILVGGVVITGLRFSYLQFAAEILLLRARVAAAKSIDSSKMAPESKARFLDELGKPANASSSALELGPIKITTTFVGLIVLSISLAFFYLYLAHVYIIRPESLGQHSAQSVTPAGQDSFRAEIKALKDELAQLRTAANSVPSTNSK